MFALFVESSYLSQGVPLVEVDRALKGSMKRQDILLLFFGFLNRFHQVYSPDHLSPHLAPPKVGYMGSPRDILPPPIPEWLELFKCFISKIIDFINKIRDWFSGSGARFPGFGGGYSGGYGASGNW